MATAASSLVVPNSQLGLRRATATPRALASASCAGGYVRHQGRTFATASGAQPPSQNRRAAVRRASGSTPSLVRFPSCFCASPPCHGEPQDGCAGGGA